MSYWQHWAQNLFDFLRALTEETKDSEIVNTSYYNLVIKKCRQLIFDNSEVIAFPNLEDIYGIYIIVKDSFYETGELQKYLSNHNLKTLPPTVVQKYIYEDCCMYTIIAKLAPKWNLVSNYFIRGRDFLTNRNHKDCVRFSLCINDKGETSMVFEVSRIVTPALSLDKLNLSNHYIQELEKNSIINFDKTDTKTIRVLPSLKRGKIVSVSLETNESWALKNYQQFRRHWKNTYGYRLPEKEDDNTLYLEISFFDGSPVFNYPSLCVFPFEPTFIQRVDPQPVITGFISDLMRCMPNILGDKYPVPSHISQPKPLLFPGTEKEQLPNICEIDISSVPDTQNSAIVYLPTQKRDAIINKPESKSKLSQLLSQLKQPDIQFPTYSTPKPTLSPAISETPHSVSRNASTGNNKVCGIENIKSGSRLSVISQNLQSQAKFLAEKLTGGSNMAPKKIPDFSKPKPPQNKQSTIENSTVKYAPKFSSKFPKIKTIKNLPDTVINPAQNKPKPNVNSGRMDKKIQDTKEDDLNDFEISPTNIKKPTVAPFFSKVVNKQSEGVAKPQNINVNRKRDLDKESESSVAKKPREKPVATEVKNMKELVNNGTINKLNIQTLTKWLKDRNIHCTSKDKKPVLVEKVINNLFKE